MSVVITDTRPISTTYQSCGPAPCGLNAGNVISWSVGTLGVREAAAVTLLAQVNSDVISGTFVTKACEDEADVAFPTPSLGVVAGVMLLGAILWRRAPGPRWVFVIALAAILGALRFNLAQPRLDQTALAISVRALLG